MDGRTVLAVTGKDRVTFLQGLVTNDVRRGGLIWAALLTPQGKYIADFFLSDDADRILIDVAAPQAEMLAKRLSMYRLRADVQIAATDLIVSRGTGAAPDGARPDPRHSALGWRLIGDRHCDQPADWDALRVAHLVPEWPQELGPDSYILEMGFDRLNGVDFRKGCYVGQEVTARMKHKTDLRKGLAQVTMTGAATPGTPILMADGREAGLLGTVAGDRALAWLRFDRAEGVLVAGGVTLRLA
jgi:tRNA-modifying protein YgfZ